MAFDYVVVGGGPSGIVIAHRMSRRGARVLLLERSYALGGCWKVDPDLSEHSPKVIDARSYPNFRGFVNELGAPFDTQPVYRNGLLKMVLYFLRRLCPHDAAQLGIAIGSTLLRTPRYDYHMSVREWMDTRGISPTARRALRTLCIALANVPEKLCAGVLFDALSAHPRPDLVRLRRPNEWIRRAKDALQAQGCAIRFDVAVRSVLTTPGGPTQVIDTHGNVHEGHTVALCVPLTQLHEIVSHSDEAMRRNWFPSMPPFARYVEDSSYIGIGLLVRFDRRIDTDHAEWCWSCRGDWTVIVIDKTTRCRSGSRSVWSCAVVDLDTPSAHLGKAARHCTMAELQGEVLRQLEEAHGSELRSKVHDVRPHGALTRDPERGWTTVYAGFSNIRGTLPQRGATVPNVFAVGPHTVPGVATLETAVESALAFCQEGPSVVSPSVSPIAALVALVALFALSPLVVPLLCTALVVGFHAR